MSELLQKIGNRIRTLRQSRNLTQENMADLLNMSPSGYAKMERGGTDLSLTRIEEIAKVFNLQPTDLVQSEEGKSFVFHITDGKGIGNNHIIQFLHSTDEMEQLKKTLSQLNTTLTQLTERIDQLEKRR